MLEVLRLALIFINIWSLIDKVLIYEELVALYIVEVYTCDQPSLGDWF